MPGGSGLAQRAQLKYKLKGVRKKRFKMMTESGVIVQNPDGRLQAVSPEEANKRLEEMKPEDRALYEEI